MDQVISKFQNDYPSVNARMHVDLGTKAVKLKNGQELVTNIVEVKSAQTKEIECYVLYHTLTIFINGNQFVMIPFMAYAEYEYLKFDKEDILIILDVNKDIAKEHLKRFSNIIQPSNGNIEVPQDLLKK